jgi:hypothetical protein
MPLSRLTPWAAQLSAVLDAQLALAVEQRALLRAAEPKGLLALVARRAGLNQRGTQYLKALQAALADLGASRSDPQVDAVLAPLRERAARLARHDADNVALTERALQSLRAVRLLTQPASGRYGRTPLAAASSTVSEHA